MTMGIGAHCNYYFLKMAATMAKVIICFNL
jgi:hypothetical protein